MAPLGPWAPALALALGAAAERFDGDVQVLMQRPPVREVLVVHNEVASPERDLITPSLRCAALGAIVVLMVTQGSRYSGYRQKEAETETEPALQAFREDLRDLSNAWKRTSSLPQALFRFCYCRHILSCVYGVTLAIIALISNTAMALTFLEPERFDPRWRMLLAAVSLIAATSVEAAMRSRYGADAARTSAAVLGLVAQKLKCLEASANGQLPLTSEDLLQQEEDLKEVLIGLFHLAVLPLQVAPVCLWLWFQLGPLTLLLISAILPLAFSCSSATVQAFVAYQTASRKRRDILAVKQSDSKVLEDTALKLRKEALDALQVIHYESQSLALCLSRWMQLGALLLFAAAADRSRPAEVLLVIFLQCQYLLRLLSMLKILKSPKVASIKHLEAVLRQEEVREMGHEAAGCLEMKGCFAWRDVADPSPLPCLSKLDLKVQRGELIAILGTAGAGKTSLLKACCGCLLPLEGARLSRSSSCIFLPSDALIFEGASLQQNILCDRPLELNRYEEVVKVCGLLEVTDLHLCGPAEQRKIALARAAYGHESLVLMDDPFAGFGDVDVLEILQLFLSEHRSVVVTFGNSAPQRAIRSESRLPGLRFMLMEAGTLQAVDQWPELFNNEAFCCVTAEPRRNTDQPTCAVTCVDGLQLLSGAVSSHRSWLLVLFLDQFLQIAIDWWIISSALSGQLTLPLAASLVLAVLAHFFLKLLVAKLGARSYSAAALCSTCPPCPALEQQMDLTVPGQLWGLLAGSCSFFGLLALSQLQLAELVATPWQLALLPIYVVMLKVLKVSPAPGSQAALREALRRTVELGAAAQDPGFEAHEERLLTARATSRRPVPMTLVHLGLCLAAAYTVTAGLLMSTGAANKQAMLILAPFGLLLHFLIPWTESLKEVP